MIDSISPQVELGNDVFIDFVPVAKDPIADFSLEDKKAKDISFFESVVILRIIVRPSKREVFSYPTAE